MSSDPSGFFAGDEQEQTGCNPAGGPTGPAIFSPLPQQQKGEGAGVPAPPTPAGELAEPMTAEQHQADQLAILVNPPPGKK